MKLLIALIKFVRETNPDVFEREIAALGGVSLGHDAEDEPPKKANTRSWWKRILGK